MTDKLTMVVVGGGQAAVEVAFTLRKQGFDGRVVIIADEPLPPYQRPPLSKTYLLGKSSTDDLLLRPASSYRDTGIELMLGRTVTAINSPGRTLELDNGASLRYDKAALTVGGRPRRFPPLEDGGEPYQNVHYLRSVADVDRFRDACRSGQRLAIIGGGYIGLEVAAAAADIGAHVTVVEAMPRVLARVTAPHMSEFFEKEHRANGVRILTGASVSGCVSRPGEHAVREMVLSTGDTLPADAVLVGIGLVPNVELAANAGLAVDGGIVVDQQCRTSDEHIFAAGDCSVHPSPQRNGALVRVESVSNAVDQGRVAARSMLGQEARHDAIPWFWSDQFDLKLQMAGTSSEYEHALVRGDPGERSFATFYTDADGLLIGVDIVNRPADFLWSRRLLAAQVRPPAGVLEDPSVPLKSLLTT